MAFQLPDRRYDEPRIPTWVLICIMCLVLGGGVLVVFQLATAPPPPSRYQTLAQGAMLQRLNREYGGIQAISWDAREIEPNTFSVVCVFSDSQGYAHKKSGVVIVSPTSTPGVSNYTWTVWRDLEL